jgi:hypothetical protein
MILSAFIVAGAVVLAAAIVAGNLSGISRILQFCYNEIYTCRNELGEMKAEVQKLREAILDKSKHANSVCGDTAVK